MVYRINVPIWSPHFACLSIRGPLTKYNTLTKMILISTDREVLNLSSHNFSSFFNFYFQVLFIYQ